MGKEEEDKESPEADGKEKETDWKVERDKLQTSLDKKTQEAKANKAFADDQIRQRVETEKARLAEDEKKKKDDLETLPEGVADYEENYPEAKTTIEFRSKAMVTTAINEFRNEINAACGDRDLGAFIKDAVDFIDRTGFERDVMLGYIDEKTNKHVAGHPDLLGIVRSPDFGKWDEEQRKEDSTYAQRENDPHEAIKIITDFKKHQLAKAAKKQGKELEEEKKEMEEQMTPTVREATRKGEEKKPDKDDFDAGFDGVET